MREWLGPLLQYDLRRKSELVLTLYQYLECGGCYDEAARALSVGPPQHAEVPAARIRDVSQLALGDPDVNFNLQLACRARRTLQALRA